MCIVAAGATLSAQKEGGFAGVFAQLFVERCNLKPDILELNPGRLVMHLQRQLWFTLALQLIASACGEDLDRDLDVDLEHTDRASEIVVSDDAIAFDLVRTHNLPHGIAGSRSLVFVTEPLNARVMVFSRLTGHHVAVLPPPEGGWQLPFTARMVGTNKVSILDTGGFPAPGTPAIPSIHEYEYTWNPLRRVFRANLVRSIDFDGIPFGFSEDAANTPDGGYVITDSILGAIWVTHPDGSITPGIVPNSFAPDDAIPQLGPCTLPATIVDGIPFRTFGDFGPGVGSVTVHEGHVYFGSTCRGGVQRVPFASLIDGRPPHERASDIEWVSAPAVGAVETLKGLNFNRFDPSDDALYALDSLQLQLLRIDVATGHREVLIEDDELFNFPVAADFLPPLVSQAPPTLVVSSDQEHRFAGINAAIPSDMFELPFLITKVLIP